MSELRQRKLKDDSSTIHSNRSRTLAQPRRLRKIFFFLIILGIFVTYLLGVLAGQYQWFDKLANSLGYENEYHHAVIIDAGSSGTRVLAYRFRVPFTVFGQVSLDLVDEYFEQSKPGLSSYAEEPEKGAETIVRLIKRAEFLTPPDKRKLTPLIVRATAGLRLLPRDQADQLVESVAKAIADLGYDVGPNSVEIMDGADEGIFIWYTVNLLHGLMDSDTMAALDLGGGSTQITYQLSDEDVKYHQPENQYVVSAGKNITLFTHSYLNLGLLAARYGIFRLEAADNATQKFVSVCVEPIVQKEPWLYANKQLYVSGAARPKDTKPAAAYEQCRALTSRYLRAVLRGAPAPARLPSAVAAMSYFYDVAADAGLIDVMTGGTVSVSRYRAAAVRSCSAYNVEQPWACLDLVYVTALLHEGYGMPDHQPIHLFKKVNGHEVSWALGLAYTTAMSRLASTIASN